MYPMFETAIRAAAGRAPADHRQRIAELWSRFSTVAAANPYAWSREVRTADEIATPTPRNRMIGWPYPKAMNSNNDVDMAAAVIVCSAEWAAAPSASIPTAGCSPTPGRTPTSTRTCRTDGRSPRRRRSAAAGAVALALAGVGIDDIALVDLYSCFPSAVQLGARSLGLPIDSQLTRTGGLSFAGGPWNSYVMHAIATMVGELRERPGELGLVWANGGFATKHAFGVYGTEPPAGGFRHANPQGEIDALPSRVAGDGGRGGRTGDDRGVHGHVRPRPAHRRSPSPRACSATVVGRGHDRASTT